MATRSVQRRRYHQAVVSALEHNPVCALLGPRQCGKTTLARELAARRRDVHFFDLETAAGRARLAEPELTLAPLEGLIIIDEVQRRPELFEALRPLADRPKTPARFLLLGSASPELVRGVSESLAGRVGFVDLGGFDLSEIGPRDWRRLWVRGGFPRSYLAASDESSMKWRRDFIRTFLERDVPQLGIQIPAEPLGRFWMMLAHYHGQIWSGAEIARSMGVSEATVRRYLEVLAGTYLVRRLPPWFQNISKRQYKSPKFYVRDSGLLHALLSLASWSDLVAHPKLGASWEGFALEQVVSLVEGADAYFWGTHAGAELDLLLMYQGRRYGIEFKYRDAPVMTKSLHVAFEDLDLHRGWIVYPGSERYAVDERVQVVPLSGIAEALSSLRRPLKRTFRRRKSTRRAKSKKR